MATLTELVETIAAVEGIDTATVGLIARLVREGGLISTGGRGPSAARMSVTDAANLLIAVNATRHANEAVRAVTFYRPMVPHEYVTPSDRRVVEQTGTLGEAIEQLIHAVAVRGLPHSFIGRTVPELLRHSFSKGNINIFLRFTISYFAAVLRIETTTEGSSLAIPDSTVKPSPSPALSFNFFPISKALKSRPDLVGRISYQTFRDAIGDRIEETTISHRTIVAVAKLILPVQG
jgi:hypothetical protein